MDIRKPNDFELKKVLSLSPQAVFDGTLGEVEPTKEKIDQLVKPLLEKGSYYLIATKKDKLMGWILIGASKDQFTDMMNGFIYELFVIEEFRGNGISKMLMRAGIDHLKQVGYTEIRLSAFVGNQAIKLYEKLGFSFRTVTMSLQL
ncbi:GNAT family N-acetyltransferase [Lysinibacillus fusiformis]|uniref:Acetyltransferase (GNAT) family protein n=1 Tax=Lysinibacillus fusiformis TaxID=28031 RepID=A0A1H9SVM7_9BACI|nr:GNAT family N-acetyltransferase [Lysinibacillus fusiformis]SCY85935.1 Acetyltransferase (GNAT) family protein [Lysinibacillus fusiformis]SEO61079.1 Acetyltransferase (GNAT) family protein [Lysinibacillus fusiformis]SER88874.1 Acetyltransferase (GNAT) family protein [Lysinibacillus fusiformis]